MKQIENIFSAGKEKKSKDRQIPNPNTPIIIDTREKQSLIATTLSSKNALIQFEHLDIADYIIERKETIAIERKTFQDFILSMINKRLMQQLSEIKKYPKHFLILEGDKQKQEISEKLKNPFKGMILSIITEYQIPIIFTQNEEETCDFLILLAKRQEKPKSENSLRFSKDKSSLEEQKQFILEGFQNIGPTTAKLLLKEFKTIKGIINTPIEKLEEVIGKKAESFRILDI